jgi:hypothetical protein
LAKPWTVGLGRRSTPFAVDPPIERNQFGTLEILCRANSSQAVGDSVNGVEDGSGTDHVFVASKQLNQAWTSSAVQLLLSTLIHIDAEEMSRRARALKKRTNAPALPLTVGCQPRGPRRCCASRKTHSSRITSQAPRKRVTTMQSFTCYITDNELRRAGGNNCLTVPVSLTELCSAPDTPGDSQ